MRNFKVKMAYNGANYHGFQRQDNALAVQQVVEEALEKLTGQKITINGCSRTDTGVHAREFYFSFMLDSTINCRGIVFGLNPKLPDDVSILSCEEVELDFHARFDCKGKEYEYIVHNSEIKNPFLYWFIFAPIIKHNISKSKIGVHISKCSLIVTLACI